MVQRNRLFHVRIRNNVVVVHPSQKLIAYSTHFDGICEAAFYKQKKHKNKQTKKTRGPLVLYHLPEIQFHSEWP